MMEKADFVSAIIVGAVLFRFAWDLAGFLLASIRGAWVEFLDGFYRGWRNGR